ncbi:hypothetical protein AWZ03_001832 [Drosophila navojoa]|uniref:Ionotropic glutamate receptor C-terminal domain-containing protein n=1 Tax=Drosophila navojoa TaxID=7232 RepID=A0A484BU72_DRONA|nr:uncharacterized protein LOC108652705 [Drosophila navojoa]TDG51772.1 hypothetical protein AWZ03_001832 [Drosophila navojoa]
MAAGLAVMQLYFVFILLGSLYRWLHCIELDDFREQDEHSRLLLYLIRRIRLERDYDTIVVYGSEPCVFHELLPQLGLPTVLLAQGSSWEDWSFSSESLLLICNSNAEQEQNPHTLLKLQQARRLVYLEPEKQPTEVCEAYFEREQVNVAMVDAVGNLYSCRCFQQENYIQLTLNISHSYKTESTALVNLNADKDSEANSNNELIYVEQFANMRGSPIRSEPDQIRPRGILYRDPGTGKYKMMGTAANLINTFVERVNATLKLRDDIGEGKKLHFNNIIQRVMLSQLDIAATLSTTLNAESFDYLSYPYMHSSFCFMIPLPQALEYEEIFTIIMQPLVAGVIVVLLLIFSLLYIYGQDLNWRRFSLIDMLLNDRCLRGLLGQCFPMPARTSRYLKGICLLICFTSLIITTMYESYLQAYFTSPPHEQMLRSFEDVLRSRYKIAVERGDASHWLLQNLSLTTTNARRAHLLDDWKEFFRIRDSFNASFVYPVMELRWLSLQEQQNYFRKPVFYYSHDICLQHFLLLSLPLRRHLPYRQLFDRHILAMQEFGISQFWMANSFNEMVRLKVASRKDYSHPKQPEDRVYLRDLTQIFIFYLAAH